MPNNIDFALLRKQKRALVTIASKLTGKARENMEGLLNLLDAIQDKRITTQPDPRLRAFQLELHDELAGMGFSDPDQPIDGGDCCEYLGKLYEDLGAALAHPVIPQPDPAPVAAALRKIIPCLANWMEIADDEDKRDYDDKALAEAQAALKAYDEGAQQPNPDATQILRDLLEWADRMGGWEAECWTRARDSLPTWPVARQTQMETQQH